MSHMMLLRYACERLLLHLGHPSHWKIECRAVDASLHASVSLEVQQCKAEQIHALNFYPRPGDVDYACIGLIAVHAARPASESGIYKL